MRRARGVDATIDQYPYTASSTTIGAALMPAWAQEGGHKETVARFKDAAVRAKIKAAIADSIRNERGGGDPANIVVSLCEWDASLAGKNLSQLTLEDAVRKMSSYPAARIGLTDRGVLKPGMKADIAVFDPATVKDMATFEKPHQYAVGFPYVIVNG